jgi:hypothetical protein
MLNRWRNEARATGERRSTMPHDKPAPLTVASTDYKPVEIYCRLRDQVLRLPAEQKAARAHGIVGALLETGYQGAVASLIMLGDGTTSLYFSSGGGVIGAGGRKPVALATAAFLKAAEQAVSLMQSTTAFPLPLPQHTRFYLLSSEGVWTAEAKEQDLGNNRLPLSPLFHLGHTVIAAVRQHSPRPGGRT